MQLTAKKTIAQVIAVVKQLSAKFHEDFFMGKNLIKVTGFRFNDSDIPRKMDIIAKSHMRNRNQEVEWALSEYIKTYESENGKIELPPEAR